MGEHDSEDSSFAIHLPEEMVGGVWANFANVQHSPYEFTIDFTRLDFGRRTPEGAIPGNVVARVNLSPLLISQLIEALNSNWAMYAEKAMPTDFRDDGPTGGASNSSP